MVMWPSKSHRDPQRRSAERLEAPALHKQPRTLGEHARTHLLPPVYLLGAIVFTVAAHAGIPLTVMIPFRWRVGGLLPLAAGLGLNLAADRQLKRQGTTVKPFERSTRLVTDGVFAWSRNPMYLGMVLLVSGIAWLEGSVTPWGVVVAFAVLLDRAFIVPEERQLEDTFGARFQQYRSHVRRWL
jgi:protein-S-isoprenylcysteine O-methyltransferase Ste14